MLKTVLITGCSSGFGRLITERYLRSAQWKVFATTRNPDHLADIESENLVVIPANVASPSERQTVVEIVSRSCDTGLDCLINNAGYALAGPLETLSEDQIRQQFEVNFFAPLLLTRDLLPSLRQSRGKVINISSVLGFVGMPLQSLYVASKFALEGLSESLSYELSLHGIDVCIVEPGGFRTKFVQNIDWARSDADSGKNGIYTRQMQGYRAFLRKKMEGPGGNPNKVADAVFELSSKSSMPLRLRIGSDTQALYYMRRSMPQKVADFIFHSASKKLMEAR